MITLDTEGCAHGAYTGPLTDPTHLPTPAVCVVRGGGGKYLVEVCRRNLKTYHLLLHCIQFLVSTLASTSTQDMPL